MTKQADKDSGFKWGPFELTTPEPWPLKIEQKGGSVHYPYEVTGNQKHSHHISQVNTLKPIIHKGNHFSHFTHPRDYPETTDWFFWDNCLIPQIMDETKDKSWTRVVYRGCFPEAVLSTEEALSEREREINQRLGYPWQNLLEFRENPLSSDRVLLILPNENPLRHYYGLGHQQLIDTVSEECHRQGLRLSLRPKLPRGQRLRLWQQLTDEPWRAVITIHSAATVEAVCAGVATVQLGQGPLPQHTISWRQFQQGQLTVKGWEQRYHSIRQLLTTVWHKEELLEGTWRPSLVRQQRPQQQWRVYD